MMEQHREDKAVQGEAPVVAEPVLPGRVMREARERLGLSVADVAGQTKFAPRQIEALEADDYRRLPEMPFVRGFVRSYARILHLDAEPLLAALPQSAPAAESMPASVDVPFPVAYSAQQQNLIMLGAALFLAVAVVTFAVWHFTTPQNRSAAVDKVDTPVILPAEMLVIAASPVAETAVIASSVPAVAPLPAPTEIAKDVVPAAKPVAPPAAQAAPEKPVVPPVPASQNTVLQLAFGGESWVEVRDKNDNLLSSQINPVGSELRLGGNAPFSLVIGKASMVRLHYRGKQVDLAPFINDSSDVARLTLE
ncbi:MAG: helix-turn-helix domain-containing protein [Nitrosomonadales bacterium]|nr:helix-turn-helix domain-containing protein [Nitrosomonadales bacterium]